MSALKVFFHVPYSLLSNASRPLTAIWVMFARTANPSVVSWFLDGRDGEDQLGWANGKARTVPFFSGEITITVEEIRKDKLQGILIGICAC